MISFSIRGRERALRIAVGISLLAVLLLASVASAATKVTLYQPSSTDITENSVRLTWSKSIDFILSFNMYEVYKRELGDSSWSFVTSIHNIDTTSYTVTGLKSGTYYEFKIRDVELLFVSADSNTVIVSTQGTPPAPLYPSYPSDKWERLWYKVSTTSPRSFTTFLGIGPNESNIPIDNDWFFGSPGYPVYTEADYIGFISSRTIYLPAGKYRFTAGCDDGCKLWIDDQLVINNWQDQLYNEKSYEMTFSNSGNHRLRLDWYEKDLLAKITFKLEQLTTMPVVTTIAVSPATSSVVLGNTQTFTAAPKDQFGNPIAAAVTWSSSNINVGTINANTGVFTAVAAGSTTITATSGSISGSAAVTVTSMPNISLSISASPTTVTFGTSTQVTFTVTRTCGTEPGEVCIMIYPPPQVPATGVTVTLSGAATGSGTTNANGQVTLVVIPTTTGAIMATATKSYTSGTTITILTGTTMLTATPSGAQVVVSDTTGVPGGNTTVAIRVTNATNLAAGTLTLSYNPSVVQVMSITAGNLGAPTTNISNAAGNATISVFNTTSVSGNVVIASVVLNVVGAIGSTSPLTLSVSSFADQNGNTIPYTVISGTLTISAVQKGDVNGDGQITVVDALFVAQYTVGSRTTLTSAQLAAADVNGDGQVTVVDALFIAQYTVGLRQL